MIERQLSRLVSMKTLRAERIQTLFSFLRFPSAVAGLPPKQIPVQP